MSSIVQTLNLRGEKTRKRLMPQAYSLRHLYLFYNMEATPRLELGVELLQSSALPLGYVALWTADRARGRLCWSR